MRNSATEVASGDRKIIHPAAKLGAVLGEAKTEAGAIVLAKMSNQEIYNMREDHISDPNWNALSFDDLCRLERAAREPLYWEVLKMRLLVHRSKLYDGYRAEIGFDPQEIAATDDFEQLVSAYKELLESHRLQPIHHDLLRVDLYEYAGKAFYQNIDMQVAMFGQSAEYQESESRYLMRQAFFPPTTAAHGPVVEQILYSTVLGLLGEKYQNKEQAEEFLYSISQRGIDQSEQHFFERSDGYLPKTERFLPIHYHLALTWIGHYYGRVIEEHGFMQGMEKLQRQAEDVALTSRQALAEAGLLDQDDREFQLVEYIGETYRRLDPQSWPHCYAGYLVANNVDKRDFPY